ncbi:MAG: hypothetical protein HFP78_08395 [Methylococcales symbiont of Hymedesmia sp. n. MRB-2018]|nr:MAG: hypothetical protein HFP78_08395 [Methylococcales symbiont of Hymedesmia sp. n. MRB-2018]
MTAETNKKDQVLHDKIQAEIAKLLAETSRINSENKWYPLIVGATATLS